MSLGVGGKFAYFKIIAGLDNSIDGGRRKHIMFAVIKNCIFQCLILYN